MSEFLKIPYVGKATEASLKLIGYDTLESLQENTLIHTDV